MSIRLFFFGWFFRDGVSLCSPGCPGTHFVDQAGLELRNPPASAPQVLGLQACTAKPGKRTLSRAVVVHAFNPSRGRQISEFEASLVYKVSSRIARVT